MPVVTFLSMLFSYIQLRESEDDIHTFVAVPLGIYLLVLLATVVYRLIDDPFVGQSIAESLLLPICLLLPTLLYVRLLVTWERTMFLWRAAKKRSTRMTTVTNAPFHRIGTSVFRT